MFFKRAPLRVGIESLICINYCALDRKVFFRSGPSRKGGQQQSADGWMKKALNERESDKKFLHHRGNNIWDSFSGMKFITRRNEKPWRHRSRIVMVFSRSCVTFASSYHPRCHLVHKRESGFEMKWNFNHCGCWRRFRGCAKMMPEWFLWQKQKAF